MIDDYLWCEYRLHARGEVEGGIRYFDCWGLVRAVRHEVYGLPLLPSYKRVKGSHRREMTRIAEEEAVKLTEGAAAPGAIATVWRAKLCIHCGVCVELDNRLGVLEIEEKLGRPRWVTLARFHRQYLDVRFYQ